MEQGLEKMAGKGNILMKCDICRCDVMSCGGEVHAVSFLSSRIAHKDCF